MAKGGGGSTSQMMEYRSALTAFSDDTLTQVYNLMLNDSNKCQDEEDSKTETNHSQMISLYNKCKVSAATIAKIEATPGFNQLVVNANKKRPHLMKSISNAKAPPPVPPLPTTATTTTTTASSTLLPRSQSRRGPSSGMQIERAASVKGMTMNAPIHKQLRRSSTTSSTSSSFSSVSGCTGHKPHTHHVHSNHHHYNNHQSISSRKIKQQPQQRNSTSPPSSPQKDRKHAVGESIPESALHFLEKLNATNPSTKELPKQKQRKDNSKKGVQSMPKRKRIIQSYNEDDEISPSDEEESSSSGVTDNGEGKEEDDSSIDEVIECNTINEVKQTTDDKPFSQARTQISTKRQRISRSTEFQKDEKSVNNKKSKSKERLYGRLDVIYEVGNEIAVYFEPENKWYQARIKEVEFLNMTTNPEERKDKTSERPKRSNTWSARRDMPANDDELRVKFYTIEYDNGEVQENIPPEDVMDKLD